MKKNIIILIVTVLVVAAIGIPAISFIFGSQKVQTSNQVGANNLTKNDNQGENENNDIVGTELEFGYIKGAYYGGYAVLQSKEKNSSGNTIYYFVDSNGKLVYKEGIYNTSHHKLMNGYFIRNYYNTSQYINASIVDLKKGENILSGTDSVSSTSTVSYGDISKNGYVIAVRKTESLAGETCKTNVEDMNGNVIYSMEGDVEYIWLCEDIFVLRQRNGKIFTVVNAQTKKTKDVDVGYTYVEMDDLKGFQNYISIDDFIISIDLETVYEKMPGMINELNDKYYLSSNGITDFTGKTVYDFAEGGFTKVYYYDGAYYVLSKNDFRYTMDENFNYIAEPEKYNSKFLFVLTSEGVLSSGGGIGIRDKHLNKIQGIDLDIDTEDIDDEMTGQYVDEFVYIKEVYNGRSGTTNKVYNLKTNEFITFHE